MAAVLLLSVEHEEFANTNDQQRLLVKFDLYAHRSQELSRASISRISFWLLEMQKNLLMICYTSYNINVCLAYYLFAF